MNPADASDGAVVDGAPSDAVAVTPDGAPDATTDATPEGPAAALGRPCTSTAMCPAGYQCLTPVTAGPGYCSLPCAGASDTTACQQGFAGPGRGVCAFNTAMGMFCGIACGASAGLPDECPTGLACRDLTGAAGMPDGMNDLCAPTGGSSSGDGGTAPSCGAWRPTPSSTGCYNAIGSFGCSVTCNEGGRMYSSSCDPRGVCRCEIDGVEVCQCRSPRAGAMSCAPYSFGGNNCCWTAM